MKTSKLSIFLISLFLCSVVSAQTISILSENFTGFSRTDVSTNNRAKVLHTDGVTAMPGWIICSGARQEAGALKLGQGSTIGHVTTPKLNLTGGNITVSFNASQYIKPASPAPATYLVSVLVDGVKVGDANVSMVWRDVNHSDPFNSYSVSGIAAATANSRITLEVGNSANGGTIGNSIILDQVEVSVNGTSVLLETFDNFKLGYSWTWNQTWDGATTYTSNSPTDLFPFIVGEVSTELDVRTQQSGWKGKAIFEKGGSAVIGWERQYNSATTEPDASGYLTTPSLSLKTGDVLTWTAGTNTGSPTIKAFLGDINSTSEIIPTTTSGSTYTYTIPSAVNSPITFKLTGSVTTDEATLSLVKIERNITGNEQIKSDNSLCVSSHNNQLLINNSGIQQVVSLYSVNGAFIKLITIDNGMNQFNLNKGVYFLKMVSGHTLKVII